MGKVNGEEVPAKIYTEGTHAVRVMGDSLEDECLLKQTAQSAFQSPSPGGHRPHRESIEWLPESQAE